MAGGFSEYLFAAVTVVLPEESEGIKMSGEEVRFWVLEQPGHRPDHPHTIRDILKGGVTVGDETWPAMYVFESRLAAEAFILQTHEGERVPQELYPLTIEFTLQRLIEILEPTGIMYVSINPIPRRYGPKLLREDVDLSWSFVDFLEVLAASACANRERV